MDPERLPERNDLDEARARIAPHVHRTPVLTSDFLDQQMGAQLYFKCENFQRTGSFKARGACNAVFSMPETVAHVATHSSGNHGQALSYAAARRGIAASIVMPKGAPLAKKAAVEGYGGRAVECPAGSAARERVLAEVMAQTGAAMVHPYADSRVIAGQASAVMELLEDVPDLDTVIAPVGGGGLISGTCLGARAIAPGVKVYAGEPEQAADAWRSFQAGHLVPGEDAPATVADGLRASLKDMTWRVISEHVEDVLLAGESAIIETTRLVWQRMKIIIEPSSAVPLATLLDQRRRFSGKRIGVILTGGNVDLDALPWMTR